jgi:topoisomerase IA-like protein
LNISHITADSWFCCGENLNFINLKSKKYIFAIKSNRRLFLTKEDREKNLGSRLSELELELEDETALPFFINNVDHQVYITKKTFTNGDGTSTLIF